MTPSTTTAIEKQAEVHAQIAHLYALDRVNATIFNRAFNEYWNTLVLSMFPEARSVKVLDLMGGTGILTDAILRAGYRDVTVLDLSEDMLGFARGCLGPGPRLCAGDAMCLPLADASFDVVVCRGGLHHLPDIEAGVREVRRVLKPGGTFLAFDPCDDLPPVRLMRRLMYRAFSFFDAEHERGLASREIAAALVRAGLTVREMRKFGGIGYIVSGVEAHLFPAFFRRLPRAQGLGRWLCGIDRRLEGSRFLLAVAFRAVKE
jgi:ubiquinone/menaquinone biosynthesis C-methylase UbiE